MTLHAPPHSLPPFRGPTTAMERALVGACLLTAALLTGLALSSLSFVWQRVEYYGHGFLIPPVALYLAWGRRSELRRALERAAPPAWGWLVAGSTASLLAVFLHAVFVLGDALFPAGLCIPLLLGSVAWALGGAALLRPLLLPLGFLLLMVPPPGSVITALTLELKLLVTRFAVGVLHLAGVDVAADGNRILLPEHTLFVADACSGLTAIVTLLPLGVIVAWFASRGVWRRAVVLGSILPLAIFANIARVVGTVLLVNAIGPEAAQGALHEGFGLGVYVLGTLALLSVARVLR